MNRLKRVAVRSHGGTTDWLNILVCILMVGYNSLDFYFKGASLIDAIGYLFPFIIYPLISIFLRSHKITTVLYMIVGLLTVALDNEISGASGLLYIYFAYNEIKTHRFGIVLIFLSYFALSIRFILLNAAGSESIVSILLFAFIFATFYFKVIKSSLSNKIDISKRDKEVIKLYSQGLSYDEINSKLKLNVKNESIRKIIKRVRDESGCNNDIQFGKWLYDNT